MIRGLWCFYVGFRGARLELPVFDDLGLEPFAEDADVFFGIGAAGSLGLA